MAGQTDNRAPYAKIAAHYAELITSGQLEPGTLLPSIKNLSEEWKVSTATAEKALRKLRNEGLVRGIHGIGTEVLDRPGPMSSGSQRQDRGRRTGSSWGRVSVPTRIRPPSCPRPMTWRSRWTSSRELTWSAAAASTGTGTASSPTARHGFPLGTGS